MRVVSKILREKLTQLTEKVALTDEETLEEVLDCLTQHISIDTQGAFDQRDLFQILVRAASNKDSIENTAKILKEVPCSNDIRYHLDKINHFEEVEKQFNLALQNKLPTGLKKKKLKLAIDLNLIPYYGKATADELPYIYRSQAKSGTCSFYAYATLYILKKNKRITLAIRGVRWLDTSVAILTYLLAELLALKIKIKTLYLDRGFFSVPVIRWLKALKIPFIMPAIRRGKTGGIKQYLKGRNSYKTNYTMSRGQDEFVTFDLWIVCKYRKGQRGKHGIEYFAYVVYQASISLKYIHEDYRKRFGIESSYRLKNLCRIKTTNKKPALRLLFVCLSFLLVNIWVNLLWRRISQPRRGGRLIYRERFTLKQMLMFLCQAVERIYQVVKAVYIPCG